MPQDERADIVAELRDLILSRFEAREEELGRALTDDEQEAILREIGHPLVVAARYRKGPDSLVGPELFPYWLFAVKAGLLLMLAVHAIVLVVGLVGDPIDAGQAVAQAFHGFFGTALTLIGAATLIAAICEHYGVRPKFLSQWRVKDLGAFGLSDPAAWSASMAGTDAAKAAWPPRRRSAGWPGGEHMFSFLVTGVFVLWWIGVLTFPGLERMDVTGLDATVSGAPIWATLYGPILIYALVQMAVDLNSAFRPGAVRLRAFVEIPVAIGGLWLLWTIFQAGHWFTLTGPTETAQIAGGWDLLHFERWRAIGDGPRTLERGAELLSLIMTWVLAFMAIGQVFKITSNLWRLVQPGPRSAT